MNELIRTHQLDLKEKQLWEAIRNRDNGHHSLPARPQEPLTEFQLLVEEARRDSRSTGVRGQDRT